jgi:hypothetical protein
MSAESEGCGVGRLRGRAVNRSSPIRAQVSDCPKVAKLQSWTVGCCPSAMQMAIEASLRSWMSDAAQGPLLLSHFTRAAAARPRLGRGSRRL